MPYEFPADIRDRLQAQIVSGGYASEEEVIRDALDALEAADDIKIEEDKLFRWTELNRLAELQSQQGQTKPLDDERFLSRIRERLEKEGIID